MFRHAMCHISDAEIKTRRADYVAKMGDFLLPINYGGHEHTWTYITTGVQFCSLCGAEHVCFRGKCPETTNEMGDSICTLTGCVNRVYNMCTDQEAMQHCHQNQMPQPALEQAAKLQSSRSKKRQITGSGYKGGHSSRPRGMDMNKMRAIVFEVVHEILDSDKTRVCMAEETRRVNMKLIVAAGRWMRHANTKGANYRPNMLDLEAHLAYTFRRIRDRRAVLATTRREIDAVINMSVNSIASVIEQHGWYRTHRQMSHANRAREFICSMLYLMRTGVTYQHKCILPKIDLLNAILPQQVFLHKIFGIRPKCITEGENIIKLDTRRFILD